MMTMANNLKLKSTVGMPRNPVLRRQQLALVY